MGSLSLYKPGKLECMASPASVYHFPCHTTLAYVRAPPAPDCVVILAIFQGVARVEVQKDIRPQLVAGSGPLTLRGVGGWGTLASLAIARGPRTVPIVHTPAPRLVWVMWITRGSP